MRQPVFISIFTVILALLAIFIAQSVDQAYLTIQNVVFSASIILSLAIFGYGNNLGSRSATKNRAAAIYFSAFLTAVTSAGCLFLSFHESVTLASFIYAGMLAFIVLFLRGSFIATSSPKSD